jgi:hypothetical protein
MQGYEPTCQLVSQIMYICCVTDGQKCERVHPVDQQLPLQPGQCWSQPLPKLGLQERSYCVAASINLTLMSALAEAVKVHSVTE